MKENQENEMLVIDEADVEPLEALSQRSHHSHHSSHSHSSHHRHHKHRKFRKLRKFFKKYNKICKIVAIVLLILLVSAVAVLVDRNVGNFGEDISSNPKYNSFNMQEGYIYVGLPADKDKFQITGDAAQSYIDADINVTVNQIVLQNQKHEKSLDIGKPVTLNFDVNFKSVDLKIASSKVEVSESSSFEKSFFVSLSESYSANIWNLKTGTKYFYKLHLTLSNGEELSYNGTFETAQGIRFMNISGIGNVRDIGGWKTANGKVINQGLLYRGTELDGAVEKGYKIDDSAKELMLEQLNIKFDMDLRAEANHVQGIYILGPDVKHKYYSSAAYGGLFTDGGENALKEIFKDLSNKNNYPMYVHCTYGRDRTGTVCYILGALLGMSENDLIKEYELSGLFYGSASRSDISTLYGGLLSYEGNNLQQKTENYLLSIGVTKAEINSIKNIFLS